MSGPPASSEYVCMLTGRFVVYISHVFKICISCADLDILCCICRLTIVFCFSLAEDLLDLNETQWFAFFQ